MDICKATIEQLKKEGFIIKGARIMSGYCVIDFMDKYTHQKVKDNPDVPKGWFISSISINLKTNETDFNFNRIPKSDVIELYIPKECGEEEGTCRVHIYYEPPTKIGFQGYFKDVESVKKFMKQFFYV